MSKYKTFSDAPAGTMKALRQIPAPSETPSTGSTGSTASIGSTASTASTAQQTSIPSTTHQNSIPSTSQPKAIAPQRDFQRIPNSVTRMALPEGLFRGKSKQVWDYLWSVSRGAVVPVLAVRRSRRDIKKGSGLGSMVTVDAALEHLQRVGLIKVNSSVGSLSGNEY